MSLLAFIFLYVQMILTNILDPLLNKSPCFLSATLMPLFLQNIQKNSLRILNSRSRCITF